MSNEDKKSLSTELTWEERNPTNYLNRPSEKNLQLLEKTKKDCEEEISKNTSQKQKEK